MDSLANSKEFAKNNNINIKTAQRYLERNHKREYIKMVKNNHKNLYEVSAKGRDFLKMMAFLRQ